MIQAGLPVATVSATAQSAMAAIADRVNLAPGAAEHGQEAPRAGDDREREQGGSFRLALGPLHDGQDTGTDHEPHAEHGPHRPGYRSQKRDATKPRSAPSQTAKPSSHHRFIDARRVRSGR